MQIKYWKNFTKRLNSTKQPSGGTTVDVVLQEDCSEDTPHFIFKGVDFSINYIEALGHYYFVTDKTVLSGQRMLLSCEVDALATEKSNIKSSTQYVTRSSVDSDTILFDGTYPVKSKPYVNIDTTADSPIFSWSDPTYLITVKGQNGSKIYATNAGSLAFLCSYFYTKDQKDIWQLLGNTTSDFVKTYFDPFSYVMDCRIVPLTFTPTGQTWIDLGPIHFDDHACAFKDVTDDTLDGSSDPISFYLEYVPTGNKEFLRSNKTRSVTLYCPGCGEISFDCEKGWDADSVDVDWLVDNKGHVAYRCQMGDDIQSASADISVPHAIYSNVQNIGGVLAGGTKVIGATIAGGVAGGPVGAVGGLITGSISAIASASPLYKGASLGSDGSRASLGSMPHLIMTETQYDIPDQTPATVGYPVCKSMTLSTNGFYMIENPQVSFGDDAYIRQSIINHMKNGFFIE